MAEDSRTTSYQGRPLVRPDEEVVDQGLGFDLATLVDRRQVLRLLEEGRECEDVVTQLAAVSKALDRAGFAIVASGLQQCLTAGDGIDSVDVKKMEKLFLSLA